ncbi:MAG: hypothetical protein QXG39_08725 [Candidatus Aenigmatarchaeota archaeon]
MSIAWNIDEFVEAKRDFRGIIVRAEYGTEWTTEGSPFEEELEEKGRKQMRIQIRPVDKPIKDQYEWYSPTVIKNTRWFYFLKQLRDIGAMPEIKGNTEEERIKNFLNELIGMEFRWQDFENLPGLREGRIIKRLLLPIEYYGKKQVKPETGVRSVSLG